MIRKTTTTTWSITPDLAIIYTDGEREAAFVIRDPEENDISRCAHILSEEILTNLLNTIKEILTKFHTDP